MADHIIKLTEEQCRFNTECRQLYNSGHMKEAYEMALERYKQSPDQLFYKFMYAIMAGDYSFDESLRQEKREELLGVAKELIKEVYFDPMMGRYEPILVTAFKNEYFFFYQLYEEQYNHGVENVANGIIRGYYSMCVGATEMAKKKLRTGDLEGAKVWATKGLDAFHEFEKIDPHWYNINFCGAEALAILGRREEAAGVFRDMYRKQNQNADEAAVAKFVEQAKNLGF